MRGTNTLMLITIATAAMLASAHAQQPAEAPGSSPAAPAPRIPASGPLSHAKMSAPDLAALQGNVETVEALLKAENELALEKARKERVQAGLEAPALKAKAKGPAPLVVDVESIAGLQGRLRAYLTANGQRYENVTVGAKVQGCRIEAIQNRCVVLKPIVEGRKAPACPTACWTGVRPEPLLPMGLAGMSMPGQLGSPVALPGGPLPVLTGGAVAPQPVPVQASTAAK